MYNLYTDKQEKFEADIELEGASLDNSTARLMVESDDWNLIFEGRVDLDGKIEIPIKKLNNILKEGDIGKLTLEVIADDTYFTPWVDDFKVLTSKKAKVEVNEQKQSITVKPQIKVKSTNSEEKLINEYIKYIDNSDIKSKKELDNLTKDFIKENKMNLDNIEDFYILLNNKV